MGFYSILFFTEKSSIFIWLVVQISEKGKLRKRLCVCVCVFARASAYINIIYIHIFLMAPVTNWLSFSLSPMEMLRSSSSSDSQFLNYDGSAAAPHYFIDNFYANGNFKLPSLFLGNFHVLAVSYKLIAFSLAVNL